MNNRLKQGTLSAAFTVALVGLAALGRANLVTNGDFGTGDTTGWTEANNDGFNGVSSAVYDISDASNIYNIGQFSSDGAASIFQSLSLTPGQQYELRFEADAEDGTNSGAQLFQVGLGSDIVGWQPIFSGEAQPTYFSQTFTASNSTETLAFSGYNDSAFYELTNISVEAVPEPASLSLLGIGALTLLRRRRRSSS